MKKIIIIAGPTAVGKTEYAIRLAKEINGEIISADSMQIYQYMNIGSAKPSPQELQAVKHYLVDEIDPRRNFSVSEYCAMAKEYIETIFKKNKTPVIAGGTGLYVNSLIFDMDFSQVESNSTLRNELTACLEENGAGSLYQILLAEDPAAAERIHPNNTKKIIRAIEIARAGKKTRSFSESFKKTKDYDYQIFGLTRDREQLYSRIDERVDIMIENGLKEEVQQLLNMGVTREMTSMNGIGYKEIIAFINGEYDLDTAVELIKRNSRRYAKRQLTWFRRYEFIEWLDITSEPEEKYKIMSEKAHNFLEN